eukprot:403342801
MQRSRLLKSEQEKLLNALNTAKNELISWESSNQNKQQLQELRKKQQELLKRFGKIKNQNPEDQDFPLLQNIMRQDFLVQSITKDHNQYINETKYTDSIVELTLPYQLQKALKLRELKQSIEESFKEEQARFNENYNSDMKQDDFRCQKFEEAKVNQLQDMNIDHHYAAQDLINQTQEESKAKSRKRASPQKVSPQVKKRSYNRKPKIDEINDVEFNAKNQQRFGQECSNKHQENLLQQENLLHNTEASCLNGNTPRKRQAKQNSNKTQTEQVYQDNPNIALDSIMEDVRVSPRRRDYVNIVSSKSRSPKKPIQQSNNLIQVKIEDSLNVNTMFTEREALKSKERSRSPKKSEKQTAVFNIVKSPITQNQFKIPDLFVKDEMSSAKSDRKQISPRKLTNHKDMKNEVPVAAKQTSQISQENFPGNFSKISHSNNSMANQTTQVSQGMKLRIYEQFPQAQNSQILKDSDNLLFYNEYIEDTQTRYSVRDDLQFYKDIEKGMTMSRAFDNQQSTSRTNSPSRAQTPLQSRFFRNRATWRLPNGYEKPLPRWASELKNLKRARDIQEKLEEENIIIPLRIQDEKQAKAILSTIKKEFEKISIQLQEQYVS